ncbi:unnamed protein product, partial [Tuber aestivum]
PFPVCHSLSEHRISSGGCVMSYITWYDTIPVIKPLSYLIRARANPNLVQDCSHTRRIFGATNSGQCTSQIVKFTTDDNNCPTSHLTNRYTDPNIQPSPCPESRPQLCGPSPRPTSTSNSRTSNRSLPIFASRRSPVVLRPSLPRC